MTPEDLRYFVSPAGQDLLKAAEAAPRDELARLTVLRKQFPPDRCRAAVTLLALRERAVAKFSCASEMAFDREGLEQASGETIAVHRARRFHSFDVVADLCCGIGGDTVALSRIADVIAVDQNPHRVALTRWNVEVYNRHIKAVCADVTAWVPDADAIFIDPSRRKNNRRVFELSEYQPPVRLDALTQITPHIAVKAAPGLDNIPPDCEAEFISEGGTCKEALLWFGDLRTAAVRRATLLPLGDTLIFQITPEIPVQAPGTHLYEPDRAVIRAHLIDRLAADIGAWKLDPEIAYLSSDRRVDTPFAKAYEVQDVLPFNLKRLRKYLSERNIGRLIIKKRRFPLTPDDLRRRLKLKNGDNRAVLFLTRLHDRPTAIVCKSSA